MNAAGSLPAVLDTGAIRGTSELADLALGQSHYWVPHHFFLLYFRTPLVPLSTGVLFLAPRLLLMLRHPQDMSVLKELARVEVDTAALRAREWGHRIMYVPLGGGLERL